MRKITLLLTLLVMTMGWQASAQCPDGYTKVLLNVYSDNPDAIEGGELWISVTSEEDGQGSIYWSQGDELGDNNGLDNIDLPVEICIPIGEDVYINAYDKFDDGWTDFSLENEFFYEITDPSGTIIIANNSGLTPGPAPIQAVTPSDGNTDGSSAQWNEDDDLEVSEMFSYTPPTCPSPSGINATETNPTDVTVEWSAGGTEAEWEVIIQNAADPAPTESTSGTLVDDNTNYMQSGLDQGTEYVVWVRAKCADDDYSYWTSNFTFTTGISCPDPSGITTDGVAGESVTITWTAGGTETQWEVIVQPAGTGLNGSSTGTVTNDNPYIHTGLDPETDYEYYIRPICADDDIGAWSDVTNFTTPCSSTTLPYEYSFPNQEADCWTFESFAGNPWNVNTGNASDGDGGHLQFNYANTTSDSWAYSKGIYLEAGEGFLLTFDYKSYSSWYTEKLKVTVGNAPSKDAQNTVLDDLSIQNTTYEEAEMIFTATESGVYYIGFNCYSGPWTYYLYVDNIKAVVPPSCPKPKDLSASNVTTTSVDLTWTTGGASSWDILYQEADFGNTPDEVNGTIIEDVTENDPYVLDVLSPNTIYNIFVRDDCADDDKSEWRGPVNIRTLCADYDIPFTENFDTDSNTTFCWDRSNGNFGGNTGDFFEGNQSYSVTEWGAWPEYIYNFDDVIISPLINLTGDDLLKFNYKITQNKDEWQETMQLEVFVSDTKEVVDFESIKVIGYEDLVSGEYQEIEIDLSTYNTSKYFAWRITGSGPNNNTFIIDNARWEPRPPCPTPGELTVDNITLDSAEFTWNPYNDNTNYHLVVQTEGTGEPTDTSTIIETTTYEDVLVTPLNSDTLYEAWVRNACGDVDGNSEWYGPITFKTLCGVATIPWEEDFEDMIEFGHNIIPDCMILEGESVYSYNEVQPFYNQTPNSGNNFISVEYDSDAWLLTPLFNLDQDKNYKVSFSYIVDGNYDEGSKGFDFELLFGDEQNSNSMLITQINEQGQEEEIVIGYRIGYKQFNIQLPLENDEPQNVYQTYEAVFSPVLSGNKSVGIHISAAFDPYYMTIDDIKIEETEEEVTNPLNVSEEQSLLEGIKLYPNPTKGVINISSQNVISSVTITNLLGQTVVEKEVNNTMNTLDISNLPTGSYFVKVQVKDQVGTYKIIKN
ncbi:fibronectin type III domain-containing protein [Aureivirga sp. CE67]|uniref:fibronectin type III domain-containing protein n=1 Tax=Aureivirga sp. CE67 TaxID=1788983 RepID=UPI0018CB9074|nr:fibronectin type III domain-containing protein [Aureivirga sp. CE67]